MQYHFAGMTLDDRNKTLATGDATVVIPRKSYELLLFLLQNPNRVVAKKELMAEVWQGRVVTENTVDQCLSKLRKFLHEHGLHDAIESVYGHGIAFNVAVSIDAKQVHQTNKAQAKTSPKWLVVGLVLLLGILAWWLIQPMDDAVTETEVLTKRPLIMLVPVADEPLPTNETDDAPPDWQTGTDEIIKQMLDYADQIDLRLYAEKPPHLNKQTFLNNQWRFAPELNTVVARLQEIDQQFTLTVVITDANQQQRQQAFSDEQLAQVIRQGSQWLHATLAIDGEPAIDQLIPENAYVTELYMRGLMAMKRGEIDKASASFELCIEENPSFHLARLELAHIRNQQGRMDESLALINALEAVQLLPAFVIEMNTLKSNVLDIQGHSEAAAQILYQTIADYENSHPAALNDLRLVLAQKLQGEGQLQQALSLLQQTEDLLPAGRRSRMAAATAIAKASVLHEMAQAEAAEQSAKRSLQAYTDLQDQIGMARASATLGRILLSQGKNAEALTYLQRALTISRELNYTMGVGASINDLLPVLITLGHLDEAQTLVTEMTDIAAQIEFPRMTLAALQHAFEISLVEGNFIEAKQLCDEHRVIAEAINNQRALFLNDVFRVELALRENRSLSEQELAALKLAMEQGETESVVGRAELVFAQYLIENGQAATGLALLQQRLEKSRDAKFHDMAISATHQMVRYRLSQQAPEMALNLLNRIEDLSPPEYPHLMLKAQTELSLGHALKAIELMQQARESAGQLWQTEDQRLLQEMITTYEQLH